MNREVLAVDDRWRDEASRLPEREARLHVPLDVLLKEAREAAKVVRRYWKQIPRADGEGVLPGLGSVLGERDVAGEIEDLIQAVSAAQALYRLSDRAQRAPLEQGRAARRELEITLRWLAGSSGDAALEAQVAALRAAHARAHSMDAIAAALHDYAALAERHRATLRKVPAFDVSVIERAVDLAEALRAAPPYPVAPKERRDALDLRNRIAALLAERLRLVRSTARFVFRDDRSLFRQVTSGYERTRRVKKKA